MPFFVRNDRVFLFIHIPKTGGSSIEAHLKQHARMFFHFHGRVPASISRVTPQHYPISVLRAWFGDNFWQDSFAVVRNPFTRIESAYQYQRAIGWPYPDSFADWLRLSLQARADDPFHLDNHLRPQVEFVDRTVRIHRFEDGLEKVRLDIEQRMGLSTGTSLPHLLKATREPLRWTDALIARVQRVYAADFRQFGYPSDPPE